jgi:hypothetical protein
MRNYNATDFNDCLAEATHLGWVIETSEPGSNQDSPKRSLSLGPTLIASPYLFWSTSLVRNPRSEGCSGPRDVAYRVREAL